jgi:hypothetical protein
MRYYQTPQVKQKKRCLQGAFFCEAGGGVAVGSEVLGARTSVGTKREKQPVTREGTIKNQPFWAFLIQMQNEVEQPEPSDLEQPPKHKGRWVF